MPQGMYLHSIHWNGNVIILTKILSLVAPKINQNDNFQCSQRWKFCQNEDISVSALQWHHMSVIGSQITVRLYTYQHVHANIKENIKASSYWPFVRGIHQWPHKGPVIQKVFHVMKLSWCSSRSLFSFKCNKTQKYVGIWSYHVYLRNCLLYQYLHCQGISLSVLKCWRGGCVHDNFA